MSGLLQDIVEQFQTISDEETDICVLPVIKVYEGSKGCELIEETGKADFDKIHSKDIEYAYYGKSAEMIGEELTQREELKKYYEWYCPIALVLDSQKLKYDKIYPFDVKEYEECEYELPVKSFELGNELQNIQKYIALFYGTNEQYLDGIGKDGLNSDSREVSTLDFIHKRQSFNLKMHTVSVIINEISSLIEYTDCIILPDKLMAHAHFQKMKQNTNIIFKEYKIMMHLHPAYYNRNIHILLREYLEETGAVKRGTK